MKLTRREILAGLASFPLLGACTRKPEEKVAPAKQPLSWPRTTTHAGLTAIELFPNDADETSPVVVAIHGLGDRPQHWVEGWRSFPRKAQIVLPQAFTPHGDGYSWFPLRDTMTEAELGVKVGESEAKLWAGLLEIAGSRKLIVTGFSQGGMLSFYLAVYAPDLFAAAVPVGGWLPPPLWPSSKPEVTPKIVALHGEADVAVKYPPTRAAVEKLQDLGWPVELKSWPEVGHAIPPPIRRELHHQLKRALP